MNRRPLIFAALVAVVATVASLAAVNLAVRASIKRRRQELQSQWIGMPADRAIGTLAKRGRRFTDTEARDLEFPNRPPVGSYVYLWVDFLMVRIDHKDNVVLTLEAEKIEFK